MRYTHGPKKFATNVANHAVWFHEAEGFEWETATIAVDSRKHYGETRFVGNGYVGNRSSAAKPSW